MRRGFPEKPCVSLKLAAVIAHNRDVVFIEFATNDAFLPYQISLEDSNQNLNATIDALRRPESGGDRDHAPDHELVPG